MKIKHPFFIVLLMLVTMHSSSFAQDNTQVGLPEGAIARFGKGSINVMQFSPDGTRLAVGTTIGVWLYDLKDREGITLSTENVGYFNTLAFSTDGKIIAATGNLSSSIQLWNTETGRKLLSIKLVDRFSRISKMVFTKNNTTLTCLGINYDITEFDVDTGQELSKINAFFSKKELAFSQNGETFVSGHRESGNIRIWQTDSWTEGNIFKKKKHTSFPQSISKLFSNNHEEKEKLDGIHTIAFSPDSKTVVSAHHDNTLRLWDAAAKSQHVTLKGHTEQIDALAFSPDSKMLASGGTDNRILLWNIHKGQRHATLAGHKSSVRALKFSPVKEGLLASGSWDGTIRFWNTHTGQEQSIFTTGHTSGVQAVAFTADNTMLASAASHGTVQIWDVKTGRLLPAPSIAHHDKTEALAFSQDATLFASHGADATFHSRNKSSVSLSSSHKETHLWILPAGEQLVSLSQEADALAISPDKKILAASTRHQGIRFWDINSGIELFRFKTRASFERNLTFSPNGKLLASNGTHVKTRVWDVATQQEITPLNINRGAGFAFSPDSTILAIGNSEDIVLWNVNQTTLQERATIPVTKRGFGVMMMFSPDGKTLLDTKITSKQDKIQYITQLWDVDTGSDLGTLSGHTGPIEAIQFSHDGKMLVSGSLDGTILLWDWEKIISKAKENMGE